MTNHLKKISMFGEVEKRILLALNRHVGPMTTNEIAQKTEVAYDTANRYLGMLLKKKVILRLETAHTIAYAKRTKNNTNTRSPKTLYVLNEDLLFGGPRCIRCGNVLKKGEKLICAECKRKALQG